MLLGQRAVALLVLSVIAALSPTATAGAADPAPGASPSGQVTAPALTPVTVPVDGPVPVTAGDRVDPAGSTGAVDAPTRSAAFTAPPNRDFRLSFDPSVDSATQQVVTAAAGIWSDVITTRVPITVQVTSRPMGPGLLGNAAATTAQFGHASFPRRDWLYPVALANQFVGRDLDTANPDIVMELSSSMRWDTRVDGSAPPSGQPMLSVAVHELGHGLGHASWVHPTGSGWSVHHRQNGATLAFAYDHLVATADGTSIATLSDGDLTSAITSSLHWSGRRGRSANGGVAPRLYSPAPFELGSSVGHLDEATFGSDVMTPFLGAREVHTSVPELTRAMLADLGWTLETSAPAPDPDPDPGTATPPQLSTTQQATAFVHAVTNDFLGRGPSAAELSRWRDHLLGGGSRSTVTRAFAFSDEWIGVIVDGLYRSTLGRGADAGGRAHWISTIRAGSTPAEVASHFYASDEYFRRAGGTATTWIRDLYAEILDRPADAGGLAFWLGRARAISRVAIALDFYQSRESRRDRVDALYHQLLGRGPDGGGWEHWATVLQNGRDVDLAVVLAASDEYAQRAAKRYR